LLDDGDLRSQRQDRAGGLVHEGFARQLPRFLLVDEEDAHALQDLQELLPLSVDPVVHRVAEHQTRMLQLIQDLALEHGIDVREEHVGEGAQAVVEPGTELLEDVELRAEGLDGVQAQRADDRDRHAYIDSGALTPRSSSPRRKTTPVARVRRSLAAVTAASGPTTRCT